MFNIFIRNMFLGAKNSERTFFFRKYSFFKYNMFIKRRKIFYAFSLY